MFEDKVLKHKRAEGYYRRNAELGNVDGVWKNFVESNKVPDPSSMKLAKYIPRHEMDNMNTKDLEQTPDSVLKPGETLEDFDVTFRRPNADGGVQQLVQNIENKAEGGSAGQLVSNTVDGSRPGFYKGESVVKSHGQKIKELTEAGESSVSIAKKLKLKQQTVNSAINAMDKGIAGEKFKLNKPRSEIIKLAVNETGVNLKDPKYLEEVIKFIDDNPTLNQKEASKIIGRKRAELVPASSYGNPGPKWNDEKAKLRNEADKAWTNRYSNISIEDKTRGDSNIHRHHAGSLREKVGTDNTMFIDAQDNYKNIRPFEKAIDEIQLKQYQTNLNRNMPIETKKEIFADLKKQEAALRKKYPQFSDYKSTLIFDESALSKTGFKYKEEMPNPELTVSEGKTGQNIKYKGVKPSSDEGKKIIGLSEKSFKEVVNNSKRGGALLTHEMLNKSEKFKKVKICKTKFANGGGGLCGKAYAEKYPQEFLQEVMKDSRMASYLKSKEALAVGKSFLSKTAKVGRWANPLTLVGGEAWWSTLAGINEFSKGKSLGEAVNEGLWFIPGKHSRDLNELLGSKAKGKKGRNLPIIPNEVRSQFDILTQLGVLINKEGALSGQLSMQQYENRRLEEEKTKRLFQERFEPKEISQDPNYYTNLLGDINWSKNIITPQIEERLKNVMTEGEDVVQKYKAADPEGQSYLKLQDKIKSKIVDEFNKGKTWDQADPYSGSIWNWIKTRENIPFTDPDLVAKQKKLDLLKEGPDQTITKENIPPELIEDFLMKFPEYKYTFEGAEGGLAGLMKKYYD